MLAGSCTVSNMVGIHPILIFKISFWSPNFLDFSEESQKMRKRIPFHDLKVDLGTFFDLIGIRLSVYDGFSRLSPSGF